MTHVIEFVTEQTPQAFVDWLKAYHDSPLDIALQRPVSVPASQELVLGEPVVSVKKVPLLIEFIHYKTVGFSVQLDYEQPQNNRSYPIQEPFIAIALDLTSLLSGDTRVQALCLADEWLYYFHELLQAAGWKAEAQRSEEQPKPQLPSQGSEPAPLQTPQPQGQRLVTPVDANKLGLTQQEREVVTHLCNGMIRKEMRRQLGVSDSRTKGILYNLSQKLGAERTSEISTLTKLVRDMGLCSG